MNTLSGSLALLRDALTALGAKLALLSLTIAGFVPPDTTGRRRGLRDVRPVLDASPQLLQGVPTTREQGPALQSMPKLTPCSTRIVPTLSEPRSI